MIAGNPHAFAEVKPMGVVAVGALFEFEGGAAFFAGTGLEPVEEGVAVAMRPAVCAGDEVGIVHIMRR